MLKNLRDGDKFLGLTKSLYIIIGAIVIAAHAVLKITSMHVQVYVCDHEIISVKTCKKVYIFSHLNLTLQACLQRCQLLIYTRKTANHFSKWLPTLSLTSMSSLYINSRVCNLLLSLIDFYLKILFL